MDMDELREQLLDLLSGGGAHAPLEAALDDWPEALRGTKPPGQPHTAWRLLEHIRIAQWDILEFSRNPKHVSPPWPEGYWPEEDAPPQAQSWERSVSALRRDLESVKAMVSDPATDLFAPVAGGEGKSLLREVLLVADHNAYHQGQLVMLRRLLGLTPTSG
jgi:uncharacterized damage-inducible protein DinB